MSNLLCQISARIVVAALALVGAVGCATPKAIEYTPQRPDHWPTEAWKTASPEAMGMRSTKLLEMVDEYDEVKAGALENGERIGIDSITIVRRGHIVAEFYLNPLFQPDTPHIIHSCTKSIVSMLVGIAIDEGKIESLQTPVLQYFPEVKIAKPDERLQAMTIEDLLTMQTGLHTEDSFLFKWRGLFKMMKTDDWVAHALNIPMDVEPGTRFDYSNISTFLLSAILTRATGTDALSFAREKLFAPLGISEVRWEQSPNAIYIGWARMWLKPTDMAKLGLLYLQKGKWEDTQVVPAAWVEASTRPQSDPQAYRYFQTEDGSTDYTLSTGYWVYANLARPFSDGYGYQWWFDVDGMYTALGHQGQYISVVPKLDLVVVFTGRLTGDSSLLPARLLKEFVVPAVESETALPDATTAVRKRLTSLATPPPVSLRAQPVPTPPATAARISGKTWRIEDNPWSFDNFVITFDDDQTSGQLRYTKDAQPVVIAFGLDDVFRFADAGPDRFAAKGRWATPEQLVVEYSQIGYSIDASWTFSFADDRVHIREFGVTGTHEYEGKHAP